MYQIILNGELSDMHTKEEIIDILIMHDLDIKQVRILKCEIQSVFSFWEFIKDVIKA
jgi:hypothetical protein